MDARVVGPAALAAGERRRRGDRRRAGAAAAHLPDRPGPAVGLGRSAAPAAAPLRGGAAVEHHPSHARLHRPVRRARRGGGVVRGAHRAARAPAVGGGAGAAARRPRLRRGLRLGLDRPCAARVSGRGDDHDAVAVPARLPARGQRPGQPRRRAGGGRAQPRPGPVAGVPEGHAASDLAGGAGRLPARDPRAAGRVRGVRNRPVPNVHRGDLHGVQARLRHGGRVRAVARAGCC